MVRRGKMNSIRSKARMAGVLYIIGTVAGILSVVFTDKIRTAEDSLATISENENSIIWGAIFVLIMGLALAIIPVVLYPVLKKHSSPLALGYVVFRGALETVTYMVLAVGWLFLIPVSRSYMSVGELSSFDYNGVSSVLLEANEIGLVRTAVFSIAAGMFYFLLYTSKLVPRFLSIWGLLSIGSLILATFLGLFGIIDPQSITSTLLEIPLAFQEMVLAVWLLIKGFSPVGLTSQANELSSEE